MHPPSPAYTPATPVQLLAAIDELKRRNTGHALLTNYFLQPLERVRNLRKLESAKSLCFLHDEWDFARIYFMTVELADLKGLLEGVEWPPIVVADWITREAPSKAEALFAELGFHNHATYDRIICPKLRRERPNATLSFATPQDCPTVHHLLLQVFDKYADHIITIEELIELIAQRQVILGRDAKASINGFVIFRMEAQKCNFYFLYHGGTPMELAGLLGNFYGLLVERGIQSGFSWVRRTRCQVLKLHESFGWKKDGLTDYIYLR